jgi:hypothetical protein
VFLYGLLAWGWFVAPDVMLVIAAYMILNLAYTFVLKHQPVVDIFTIAIGFVLRVYAGAVTLAVPVSSWMFITTLCLALYLAAVKRRQELSQSGTEGRKVLATYSVSLVDVSNRSIGFLQHVRDVDQTRTDYYRAFGAVWPVPLLVRGRGAGWW